MLPYRERSGGRLLHCSISGWKFTVSQEFPHVNADEVAIAMKHLENQSTVFMFHAELDISENHSHSEPTKYSTFLNSRPQRMEYDAIQLIISLQRSYPDLRCHIVHLSASDALPLIRAAKADGIKLTVETTFHYLSLISEDVPDGRPEFKCCPPIRDNGNRELLWRAVKDGTIDCVVTDHSPCVASLKSLDAGNIMEAWGGISGLGFGLHLLWDEGRRRGLSVGHIARLLSETPAEHAGLKGVKGRIATGYDADFVIWDPEAGTQVKKETLQFKNKLSPYEGLTLKGAVRRTILRGQSVWTTEAGYQPQPLGRLL